MPPPVAPVGVPLLVALQEMNSSGQTGHAMLEAQGEMTQVTLSLPVGALESGIVHIHTGQCGVTLGGVAYPLTDFVDGAGTSITMVDAPLAALQNGNFAINAHQASDPSVYTACGNIPTPADSLTLALDELNDSGQSGWATLATRGEQTDVVLRLSEGTMTTEAVHIHTGQCGDTLGGVEHALLNFVGGAGGSVTTIDATLASLRDGDHAINAHQAGDPSVYTACGDVPSGETQTVQIGLGAMNESGQSGWATLTEQRGQTVVTLWLGEGAQSTEAVHIHSGQCGDSLGGVVYALTSFDGGAGYSVTVVDAPLIDLLNGAHAINAHQAGDPSVYTACGDIPSAASTLTLPLEALNSSGQSGHATLTGRGDETEVVLRLTTGGLQSELVHVHLGQCGDTLGAVDQGLMSFSGGAGVSITTVGVALADLRDGDHAINAHSQSDASVYTACGSIAAQATASEPPVATPVAVSLAPAQDATLYENAQGIVANGSGEYLFAGNTASGQTRRAVLRFDLAAQVPQGATVQSVALTLRMSKTTGGDADVALHRLTKAWSEGASDPVGSEGSGSTAATGDATWVHSSFDSESWATQGGDFMPAASAVLSVGGLGDYTWVSSSQLVADVQAWLDDASDNHGWILLGGEAANRTAKRFDSRENSSSANRPVLAITYVAGG